MYQGKLLKYFHHLILKLQMKLIHCWKIWLNKLLKKLKREMSDYKEVDEILSNKLDKLDMRVLSRELFYESMENLFKVV